MPRSDPRIRVPDDVLAELDAANLNRLYDQREHTEMRCFVCGGIIAPESDVEAQVVLLRSPDEQFRVVNVSHRRCMPSGVIEADLLELLWLFTGKVPRLSERAKGLRKGEDPVICRYRPDGPARVRLTIGLNDGRQVTFQREGGADRSTLTAWNGPEQLDAALSLLEGALGLKTTEEIDEAVGSWGILQQHALVAALDAGPALHQRLAEVVGLEQVTRFASAASETTKRLKAELKRLRTSTDGLLQRRKDTEARLDAARSALSAHRPRLPGLVQATREELPWGIRMQSSPAELEDVLSSWTRGWCGCGGRPRRGHFQRARGTGRGRDNRGSRRA